MRKFRHLLGAIKTLTLNYLASEFFFVSRCRRYLRPALREELVGFVDRFLVLELGFEGAVLLLLAAHAERASFRWRTC